MRVPSTQRAGDRWRPLGAAIAALLLLAGCERTELQLGDSCELNSDCASPLVCRLERCRVECRGTRDCEVGLLCIPDEEGVGACQVEDECRLASDCPAGLICTDHRCTTECATDIDCPSGARCESGPDGTLGCVDRSEESCQLSSDCAPGLRCAPDRRCREPCRADRDCRDGRRCLTMGAGPTMCGVPSDPDLGVTDGGMGDGGPGDGGLDGGLDDLGGGDGGLALPTPPSRGTLTAGTSHSCVFVGGTGLRCWGQWRNPDASAVHFEYDGATAVALPSDPFAVMSGANHGCALFASEVRCWGDNTGGQLGQDPGPLPFSESPVVVPLAFPAHAMGGGLAHSCVVAAGSGEVWCWGDNTSGQLGHAGSGPTPGAVTLPLPAVDVAARNENSCALLTDGSVHCWGANGSSQLGSGTAAAQSMTPVAIVGISGAEEVDVGSEFGCARNGAGEIRCWGNNDGGQLATGSNGGSQASPNLVALPQPAAEIETGQAHACARLTDGSVHCWGLNVSKQSGAPTALFVTSPLEVIASGSVELTTGDNHGCSRSGPSAVACWGSNAQGQLGSAGASTPTPMTVPGL